MVRSILLSPRILESQNQTRGHKQQSNNKQEDPDQLWVDLGLPAIADDEDVVGPGDVEKSDNPGDLECYLELVVGVLVVEE